MAYYGLLNKMVFLADYPIKLTLYFIRSPWDSILLADIGIESGTSAAIVLAVGDLYIPSLNHEPFGQ